MEHFIDDQVTAGRFSSVAEVVEAALSRLMLDPESAELDAEDIAAIDESEAQITRGESLDWKNVSASFRRKYLGA